MKSVQNSLDNDLLYWNKEKGQNFVNAFRLQLPSHMQVQSASQTKGSPSNVGSLQLQPETHSAVSLSTTNIKTEEDLVKYHSVNSSAFKRWFGDSKVVDADGKPLIVYHGIDADFNEFSRQSFGKGMGDEGGRAGVSKLPMRQITLAVQNARATSFSKLPIRQLTAKAHIESLPEFSKLPIRQLTG